MKYRLYRTDDLPIRELFPSLGHGINAAIDLLQKSPLNTSVEVRPYNPVEDRGCFFDFRTYNSFYLTQTKNGVKVRDKIKL